MSARPSVGAVPALLVLLTGCGGGEPADSAAAPADTLRGRIESSIGVLEGDAPYMFGRIAGVVRDERGRIYVTDTQASDLRVFSPAGEFLFTIGRHGEGPGEFDGPCCTTFGPDGLLWVRDGGNARYQALSVGETGAEYADARRMAHGDVNFHAPVTFDRAGRLIDIGHRTDAETGRLETVRFTLDTASAVVGEAAIPPPPSDSLAMRTVTRTTSDGRVTFYLWQPYGPMHLLAHGPAGEWAEALSSRYAIQWSRPGGPTLEITRPDVRAPTLSAAERDRAEERLAADFERTGLAAGDAPFGVPDRKPPLDALYFDRDGRLWVQLSVADGAPRRADVYDPSGRAVAHVVWPRAIRLRNGEPGLDSAVGVTTDSLGVQRVVRLRLEEPGS